MTGFMFGLRGLLQTTRFALDASKNSFHIATAMPAKVAVILSGCGMYDGSECHEVSAVLVHLSRSNAEYSIFAPDKPQMDVIDHIKGTPMEGNKRNVMVESARLARGKISALSELDSSDFDAVVFPGGFGAAKNLSTFAVDSSHCMVIPEVELVIKDFHSNKKPIGVACISPVLVARTLAGVTVTVGSDHEESGRWPYAGTAAEIVKMGARHIKKNVTEAYVDPTNNVVSSPAFMCNAKMHEVHDGIGEMIRAVLGLIKK